MRNDTIYSLLKTLMPWPMAKAWLTKSSDILKNKNADSLLTGILFFKISDEIGKGWIAWIGWNSNALAD